MTNKTRKRLHKTLARLRGARQLLGGVSLLDGIPVFDASQPVYVALRTHIEALEKSLPTP